MNTQTTVCLVEDLDEIRYGVVELLHGSPDFLCLSAFADAETAMEELPAILPDIVIMDINLPGISGTEAIRKLSSQCPQIRFLMFTIYENNEQVFEALKAGASGYLLKNTAPDKFLDALRELYEGGAPMSAQIARKVVGSFRDSPAAADESFRLTQKEKEVLDALAKGWLYKEIAEQLQINTSAVRQRIHKIYGKLHVQNRTEAMNKLYKK